MHKHRIRRAALALALTAALGAAEAQGGMMGSPDRTSPGGNQGLAPLEQPYAYGPRAGYGMMDGFGRYGSDVGMGVGMMERFGPEYGMGPRMMSGVGRWGYGMMGRFGPFEGGYGMGPGMMPGFGRFGGRYGTGPGVMGDLGGYGYGHGMGPGMMGGFSGPLPQDASPLAMADIRSRLDAVLARFPAGAKIADVMPFTNNVYAQVIDAQGNGLAELLVDRFSGLVMPEPGPNMMWGLEGPMAGRGGYGQWGMTGGYGRVRPGSGAAAPAPRFDEAQARSAASAFVATYAPGASVLGGQAFDGYYTFDYGVHGPEGMLSVNAFTGEVWPHTWHGAYLGTGE